MGHKIVLTADRTLMSSYNGSMFIGFAACFPRVLPKWLYKRIFCPSQPHVKGEIQLAPAGLRKIQASLLRAGIPAEQIAVAHPEHLGRVIDSDTRVVGINTSDPLGLGPASSTFSSLLERESYTAYFFRQLVNDRALNASGAKIIVGGPGTWQLSNERTRAAMGIDCIVEGEGELVAPKLFMDAVAGRQLPSVVTGGSVPVEDIPLVAGATINGTVEISRGCGRGCEFCNPNMRLVRHLPMDRILEEVRINLRTQSKITLHAEDVLRYKAKSMTPDRDEVLKLFERVMKLTDDVGMSHIALSSALAEPRLVEDLSALTGAAEGKKHLYAQTGIETGSPSLVSKHMKGKAKPFDPSKWPEVVRESFKLLSDNNWVPCGTLVMGMPSETKEDVEKTVELVADLRKHKCFIVPLFFVPLGELKGDGFFRPDSMLPEHWTLLGACIDHDFHWFPRLMDDLFSRNRLSATKSSAMKLASWYMQRRLKESLELMREGKDPRQASQDWSDLDSVASEEAGQADARSD
ncbi:MAG TPA: radical SAM protein [Thermoplasmata archaeon]|nr:radical SAM protein [Thermoplasmata archaeon]